MKRIMDSILLLALGWIAPCQASASNSKTWVVYVGQGPAFVDDWDGIHEAFYLGAKKTWAVANDLKVPASHRRAYFGHWGGKIGYRHYSGTEKLSSLIRDFDRMKEGQAGKCELAGSILTESDRILVHQTKPKDIVSAKLADLDGDGTADILGGSTKKNFRKILDDLSAGLKPGDLVLFNYYGNGLYDKSEKDWYLAVSDGDLKIPDFEELTRVVESRGARVQIHVSSCYSGGFTRVGKNSNSKRSSCVVTSDDPSTLYYGTIPPMFTSRFDSVFPEVLRKYKNPLAAYACSLSVDGLNVPRSSLLEVVEDWEKQNKLESQEVLKQPIESYDKLKDLGQAAVDADDQAVLREKLKQALVKYFATPMTECHHHAETVHTAQMNRCYDSPDFLKTYPKGASAVDRAWMRDPWTRSEKNDGLDQLNRMARLVAKAEPNVLQDFKDRLCCLSTSLSDLSSAALCE